jgi:8-oxo-dGTP pyrophosphatase MutT (NUDIX family)
LADSACAIIHTDDGRVLTVTRKNSSELCLPGGKSEAGETPLMTVVREVAEETGLYLKPKLFIPVYSEIVVGNDNRDFYCVTFVYKQAIDASIYVNAWEIEKGIKVAFNTWGSLHSNGVFIEYNKRAEDNFRKWQQT